MEGWFTLFGWLLSVLAAAGNTLVVFLIAKKHRLHCPSNWFVLSLAVADLGVGLFVFPTSYLCNLQSKPCNMTVYVAFYWFLVHSSVTNLCSLTWDRYITIVHPFKYVTSMTTRRPGMVISISWLIPVVISLTMALGKCFTNSQTAWKVLYLSGISGFDLLSSTVLLYAVVRILIVTRAKLLQDAAMENIRRDLGSIELQPQQSNSSTEPTAISHTRKKHKTVRFIFAIVTFFLGCYVVVNYLTIHISVSSNVTKKAGLVVTLLLVTNSAVNPLVYAILKRDIKNEIIRLFRPKARQERQRMI